MTIRKNPYQLKDRIIPSNILVSVTDKESLENVVEGFLEVNPRSVFYSTGGTGGVIEKILGCRCPAHYLSIEEYTGISEMEGGLVKTIHPKVHAGLLSERGNPKHESYLRAMEKYGKGPGVYFDVLICNLYEFEKAIAEPNATPETARINIDVGGPGMIAAATKNWPSVATMFDPSRYKDYIEKIIINGNVTDLEMRFNLAKKAMKLIGNYRYKVSEYFEALDYWTHVHETLNIDSSTI